MKHRVGFNRLSRKPSHRKALHRNMVTSLFRHERIRTTKAKAQAIRRTAEKMITRAKTDSVHNRRMVARDIKDKAILAKLFAEIAPRFVERPGGYTRLLKIGPRQGDAAEMVLLELVGESSQPAGRRTKRAESSGKPSDDAEAPRKSAAKKAKNNVRSAEETPEQANETEVPDDADATGVSTDASANADTAGSGVEPDAVDDTTDSAEGSDGDS